MMETAEADKKALLTERAVLILAVVLGAFQGWVGRFSMNPDGVSYLDIGDVYLRGDWKAAVNGYWSPLYSVLLGAAMRLFRPSIRWEFPAAHLVSFGIYLAALFSFRFFLRSTLDGLEEDASPASDCFVPLPAWVLHGIGYSLFLWSALVLIDISVVTPDLLVAALVFLLGGLLLDLRRNDSLWKFSAFGALNGAAYLSKGIMFPMAFVFLTVLLFSGNRSRARIRGVLLSAVVFLVVCSPFVLALSKAKGRLTYGDTGKLAYARMVSPGSPETNWQGEPAGSGVPLHPTRKLLDDPPVFEFAEPIGGTYPPWYDPSYWNDGVQPRFRLRSQLRVLVEGTLAYGRMLEGFSPLLVGVLIFLLLGKGPALKAIARNWPLLIVCCAAAALYLLVLVKTRYMAAFAVLFWLAILSGIRLPRKDTIGLVEHCVGVAVIVATLSTLAASMADAAYHTVTVGAGPSMEEQIAAAEGLRGSGLQAGDKVAVIGEGINDYWARLARFKIVSQVTLPGLASREFWASPRERRDSAYECLSRSGARVVVAWNPPSSNLDPRWKRISDTNYYAYFFPK